MKRVYPRARACVLVGDKKRKEKGKERASHKNQRTREVLLVFLKARTHSLRSFRF
jgi:hypothetical protein